MNIILNSVGALFFLVASLMSPDQFFFGLNHGDDSGYADETIMEFAYESGLDLAREVSEASADGAHSVRVFPFRTQDSDDIGIVIELFLYRNRLEMIRFSGTIDKSDVAEAWDDVDFMLNLMGYSTAGDEDAGSEVGDVRLLRSEEVEVALWTNNTTDASMLVFDPRASRRAIHFWGRTWSPDRRMPVALEAALLGL